MVVEYSFEVLDGIIVGFIMQKLLLSLLVQRSCEKLNILFLMYSIWSKIINCMEFIYELK